MDTDMLHPPKRCTKCGNTLPSTLEYFYAKKNGLYGLFAHCKKCHTVMTKPNAAAWNKANPERAVEHVRKYHRNHPEKKPVYDPVKAKQYRMEHADQIKAKNKRYAPRRDKSASRLNSLRWAKENPDRCRVSYQRRKARKQCLPDTLTVEEWKYAIRYFNNCCAVCGRQLTDLFSTHKAAADHWIPLSASDCPGTVATNTIPLCHGQDGCNNQKKDRPALVWLIDKYGKRKAATIFARIQAYFDHITTKSDALKQEA